MTSADERRLASRFARRTRYLRQHARLSVAALLGLLAYLALPARIGESARLLAAFDLAAFAFLAAIWGYGSLSPAEMAPHWRAVTSPAELAALILDD